ncbi:hypothetical protein B566_EDAN000820, partial [Ephemera danica]
MMLLGANVIAHKIPSSCRGLKLLIPIKSAGPSLKKQINKDNKEMFGDLLETKLQRLKRIDKEPSSVEIPVMVPPPPKRVLVKQEHKPKYLVDISNFRLESKTYKDVLQGRLKKLKIYPKAKEKSGKNKEATSAEQIENAKVQNIPEKQLKSNNAPVDESTTEIEVVDDVYSTLKSCDSSPLLLPDAVIKKLTSFPMTRKSKSEEKDAEAYDIVSMQKRHHLPSVSKILNATMSEGARMALQRWRSKLIEQLGEEGFLRYNQGQMSQGARFHELVQSYLLGETPAVTPDLEGCWSSLNTEILPNIGGVECTEKPVVHPWLLYHGVVDCLAQYNGKPMVIEWKKSERRKTDIRSTFDAPLQLTAY